MVEDPKKAEKALRDAINQGMGAREKVKVDVETVAARFESFKKALKEEVSQAVQMKPGSTSSTNHNTSNTSDSSIRRAAARQRRK